MSVAIVADSSGLVSLISAADHNHKIALQITKNLRGVKGSVIIPGDVFSETLNVVGKKIGHGTALRVGKELVESGTYLISEANPKIRQAALNLFKSQPQSVSFTDCMVMAYADQHNTKNIFGFDDCFRRNGYFRLGFDG